MKAASNPSRRRASSPSMQEMLDELEEKGAKSWNTVAVEGKHAGLGYEEPNTSSTVTRTSRGRRGSSPSQGMMNDMAEEIQLNIVSKNATWNRQTSDASTAYNESDGFSRQVSPEDDFSRQVSDDGFSRQVSAEGVKKKTIGLSAAFWDNVAASQHERLVESAAKPVVSESNERKEPNATSKPIRRRGSSPSAQMMADMAEHKDWKDIDDGAGNLSNAWGGGLAEHRGVVGGSSHKLGGLYSKDVVVKHAGYANGQPHSIPASVEPVHAVVVSLKKNGASAVSVRRGRISCPAMQMMHDMANDD